MERNRSYAISLTVLSALGRLIPHPPNFTPLGGSCVFAGSRINGWMAYLLPLAVMIATDPIVGHAAGGHSGYTFGSPLIYASFMISVWIGRRVVKTVTPLRVGSAAFLGSLQFFLLSNLPIWLDGQTYARTFAGLVECYVAALPFFGRALGGDLLYSAALFGVYTALARRMAEQQTAVA